jgi:peptidyl-prolyl cis-trans isomerase A (cyclophilin A)
MKLSNVLKRGMSIRGICFALCLSGALGLAGCGGGAGSGGGSGGPSVSNLQAETVQYGRAMIVSVSGAGLSEGVRLDGGAACPQETAVAGGTDNVQRFTCRVAVTGELVVRIRTSTGGRELASLRVSVPNPQVSIRLTQAAQDGPPSIAARSGTFVVELDPVAAPRTVNNFLDYVNGGFYANTIFQRVERDILAEAGGYTNTRAVKPPTAPAIPSEANNGLKNVRYSLAMARGADPNSATSVFFVNLADNPGLDFGSAANPAGFTVFGRVVSGQEVIDVLNTVEVRPNLGLELPFLPVTNVVIAAATQTR